LSLRSSSVSWTAWLSDPIKRLQRRTICFSKSPEMHDAVIKLFTTRIPSIITSET
jgi:IS1 transposase